MKVEIRFRTTEAFEQDTALFGVTGRMVETMRRNLRTNPFLGEPDPADPLLRRYAFRGHAVTYRISEAGIAQNIVVIWLLTLRPVEKPKAMLTRRALKLLDLLIKLKGALGGVVRRDD